MSIRSKRWVAVGGALSAIFIAAAPLSLTAVTAFAQTASTAPSAATSGAGALPAQPPAAVPGDAPGATQGSAPVLAGVPKVTDDAVNADLPHDLSVQAMFHNADIVVKSVMLGLVAASVLTWTILLAKGIEITGARRSLRRDLNEAMAERSLPTLQMRQRGRRLSPGVAMVNAAAEEILASGERTASLQDRVVSRLRRLEAGYGRRIGRGTGFLATIGATSPFIGLFGTVWGIMNSFIGISQSHTTNLAVVAPGIAEALLATATGLVAAIPAVVIYNMFARVTGGYRAQLTDLSAAVTRIVSRDLDAQRGVRHAAE